MDKFKHFLIRNNLYAKFSNNLQRAKCVNYEDWIRNNQLWEFSELISYAFIWRNTPEGHMFWQGIMERSRNHNF